jgi:two-component system nitrate/nitrite response regulator NarL
MNAVILTPVRLLGDGLAMCLGRRADIAVVAVISDLAALRGVLTSAKIDVALIDVMQPIAFEEVRAIAIDLPDLALVAFGLPEQRHEVIRCGRFGFAGYVPRDATIDQLSEAIANAVAGRLACPAEISSGLLRSLFRRNPSPPPPCEEAPLTRREGEVLQLIGSGLTNKEIARELDLSVATVKHHVHNILDKLRVPRRSQAMRCIRDNPWITSWPRRLKGIMITFISLQSYPMGLELLSDLI